MVSGALHGIPILFKDNILTADGLAAAVALSDHGVDVLPTPMGAAAKCTGKAGASEVTIPVGLDETSVPFGISFFASLGSDARLLAIAAMIEEEIGARKIPTLPTFFPLAE